MLPLELSAVGKRALSVGTCVDVLSDGRGFIWLMTVGISRKGPFAYASVSVGMALVEFWPLVTVRLGLVNTDGVSAPTVGSVIWIVPLGEGRVFCGVFASELLLAVRFGRGNIDGTSAALVDPEERLSGSFSDGERKDTIDDRTRERVEPEEVTGRIAIVGMEDGDAAGAPVDRLMLLVGVAVMLGLVNIDGRSSTSEGPDGTGPTPRREVLVAEDSEGVMGRIVIIGIVLEEDLLPTTTGFIDEAGRLPKEEETALEAIG